MSLPLAVCVVADGDDRRLGEWLDFHRRVGVGRFFLYRRGGGAVAAADIVDVPWPRPASHREAAADSLARSRDVSWLAFLGLEEFLFATDGSNLATSLAVFARHPAVGVNRLIYAPPAVDGPVLGHAIHRAPEALVLALPAMLRAPGLDRTAHENYRPLATRVAFVVQPAATEAGPMRDEFRFHGGLPAVDEAGRAIDGQWSAGPSFGRLRVNHYLSETGESLPERFAGLSPARREDFTPFRSEIDTAILPIAAGLS
ncbi:hypothetical protein EDC65_4316 [Stella humosa]|uniref:Uncharacterized protein n=1 Tax=Stella humosa TaxID=94 RepID=A0A3N1KWS8_9PROT|nr:hypothetical protein [Stella humosa]ROP83667.1 hypothetical protein EDC65_4316 [Stella humosa]BBK33060.1 hypothetical protein STHU_36940 [Stella humosa]